MRNALIALLTLTAATQGAAAKLPPTDDATFEHYYRFLATLFHGCPTGLQVEAIEQAEVLYQHYRGWRAPEKSEVDKRKALRDTLSLVERLRKQYPAIELAWKDDGLGLAPGKPIVVTRDVTGYAIAMVRNGTEELLNLTPFLDGHPPHAGQPFLVPPGETRPIVLPLSVSDERTTMRLSLAPDGDAAHARSTAIPIAVVEPALIRGTLLDEEHNGPWPGRVYVKCADNVLRHGKAFADNATLSEKPVVFRPASWRFPFFYSDGTFEIAVPPGETEVALERGFEHEIVKTTVSVLPGQQLDVTLRSGRFRDMKAEGWISGDTHIHWTENSWDVNEDIALLALVQRAEDLRVANNLLLYQWRPTPPGPFTKPDQYPMGPVPGYCDDEYHIQMAQEYRNDSFYGHINLLNIKEVIQPIATGPGSGGDENAIDYPINKTIIEECHAQGGICCEAHGMGPFENSDVPANVATDLSDVLDQMDPQYYYRLLNCGMRIPLGNGSDHPARITGCARVYVKVEGPFTYQGWIDGLKAARSFVSSGPLLFLTVNGTEIGDVVDVPPGTELRVRAHAQSRHPIGNLQIVSNGEVVAQTHTSEREATLEWTVKAKEPRWFVARCAPNDEYAAIKTAEEYHTARPDVAHTSAIYINLDGKPVLKREALETVIANLQRHADDVRARANFDSEAQREEALAHIHDGIARYGALLAKAP